ncbi:DUF547 domain-containing protein [Thermodesulfobacteriota bacterium]
MMLNYFSPKGFRDYIKIARKILEGNWTGHYTKPAPGLYPHQWNWDSCFIAIGVAHYNQKRAQQEMLSLFQHQWPNGMVPQIVFNPRALGHYFPEPDFWQVPDDRPTSGITMPPLHAIACMHIYKEAKDRSEALDFLKFMFPKFVNSHRYFYQFRDPERSGLVYIRHPWESGLDNSPAWDKPIKNIRVDKGNLPPYERKDLQHGVPPEQRPSNEDYDRYVYLVDIFRRLKYHEEDIYHECPFLIRDVLFNSILCRANRDLLEIGQVLKRDTAETREWLDQTIKALSVEMWCSECNNFESFDLTAGKHLNTPTAAGFMPLFAGAASSDQAETLYNAMDSAAFCALHQGNCFTIPNYDMTREDFDAKNYWRGPVWININWMLSQGLKNYGYREKSDAMKKDMIQLPIRFGFHEYFDSQTGQGYGSSNFSWTTALFLELVYEYYNQDKHSFDWLKPGKTRKLKKIRILNNGQEAKSPSAGDLGADLMLGIRDLKEKFYDMNRGRIDYGAMKRSTEYTQYQGLAAQLLGFDLKELRTAAQKKAFWINLYNTIVVHGIVELGVNASVKEVPDFFRNVAYQIGNDAFSAEEIEHGILRANARPPYSVFRAFGRNDSRSQFRLEQVDPRIHFALVCGSRSCAPIGFYSAEGIDGQLERAAKNFINSSEVIIIPEKKKIFLSQIFNWYKGDFGGNRKIFQFLIKYLNDHEKLDFLEKHMDSLTIEYLFYDWNLNH